MIDVTEYTFQKINERMNGELEKRIDDEIVKAMLNCENPEIDYRKMRKITITVSLKPNEARSDIAIKSSITSNLASADPLHCSLSIPKPQMPGQCVLSDTVQEEDTVISMVR